MFLMLSGFFLKIFCTFFVFLNFDPQSHRDEPTDLPPNAFTAFVTVSEKEYKELLKHFTIFV